MEEDVLQTVAPDAFSAVAAAIYEQISARGDEIDESSAFASESLEYAQLHGSRLEAGGLRSPFQIVAVLLLAQLHAVVDFLNGIATIAVHGGAPGRETGFSAAPVARALLEALARIYWLAESGVGAEERVRRLVDDTVRDELARHRVLAHLGEGNAGQLPGVDDLAKLCDSYGVKWRWGKPDRTTGVRFPVLSGQTRPSAFDTLSPLMPSKTQGRLGAVFYSLMSDVAHASTQGLLRPASVTDGGDRLHVRFDRLQMLDEVKPVLWAVNQPVMSAYSYLGWNEYHFRETFATAVARLAAVAPTKK